MQLDEKLTVWQKDLIDMSKRNTLLYYKLDGVRPSGLPLPDVDTESLYDHLVIQKRAISEERLGLPDPDIDPAPMRRLERLRVQARDDVKERGVQSLYMVFGLLEWFEAGHSEEVVRSPLLLVPVAITFGGSRTRYTIKALEDEDIEVNPTLRERFLSDFHLALPSYEEIAARVLEGTVADGTIRQTGGKRQDGAPRLDSVMDALLEAIDSLPDSVRNGWSIRHEAHLGRFSFQKLVMWQDLQRNLQVAHAHSVLQRIAGVREALQEPAKLIRADQLDKLVRPQQTLEILDADSSQQEAIQAAKAGRTFVLQGPPGTGKSQTIANIIAECLGQGKKVLFVSEKMAALDVVRKRLESAGLGEFLLDLHDAKQNRREFVSELERAVRQAREAPTASGDTRWQRESEKLEEQRDHLNQYVHELHEKRFALQISAHEAYGRLAQLVAVPASDFGLTEDIKTVTPWQLEQMRESLQQLLDYGDVLDTYWSHPWRDTLLTSLSSEQASNIEDHFGRLSHALDDAESELTGLADALGEPDAPITFDWATHACDRVQLALNGSLPPAHWFDAAHIERLRPTLQQAREDAVRYHLGHSTLDGQYGAEIYHLSHSTILDALTDTAETAIAKIRSQGAQDAHDVALNQREQLERRLTTSASLLRQLVTSAGQVAQTLSLPTPVTLDAIDELTCQASLVARTPTPPRAWLDPDAYTEARITALDAIDKAQWARQARSDLMARYTPDYFEADLTHIEQRFSEQYDSFVRYLRPQFYLDMRTLRRYLQPGASRTVDEMKSDVATVVKLRGIEQWQAENRAAHARLLGRHYNGEQTDWTHARTMVEWADAFHSAFTDETATDAVSKLICGPASGRAALMTALEPLTAQWSAWAVERGWLETTTFADTLLRRADSTPSHAVAIAQAIEDLLQNLRLYWSACDQVISLRNGQRLVAWSELVSDVELARAVHAFEAWIDENKQRLAADLGESFSGASTDWAHACDTLDWAATFVALYPKSVPGALVAWIAQGSSQQRRDEVSENRKRALDALSRVEDELQYAERVIPRARLRPKNVTESQTTVDMVRQRGEYLRGRLPLLTRWVACGERIMECRALGLGALIDASLKHGDFPRDIVRVFDRRFYALWLDAARASSPALKRFSGDTHERLIEQFREFDKRHQQLAQQRLTMLLSNQRFNAQERAANAAQSNSEEERAFARVYSQLVREAGKKRSPAIREIVRKVRPALIELKPCWMMSPLTVSQFVETAQPIFDLVIFDEASQVLTEDAICAILRGKQLIVVGDEKQLPPTSFFSKSLADSADDDDDEQSDSAERERTESILKELMSADIPPYALKWHYRSQHESLIAFSNAEFYGDQLITFPGPEKQHSDGVHFIHVADGVYDRSSTRTNRREAERVVDLVIQLAQRNPEVSLGVVALSGAQQNAIRDALANRFKMHPELAVIHDTLNEDDPRSDAFFVKNLESVQGDERDIIVLSIGYGKDRSGQVHANFGPVNRNGGERRLNVAVTRARRRMYVVSSIHGTDISPTQSIGVRTLRKYLNFAEYGPSVLANSPTTVADDADAKWFDSPFEQAVYDALTGRGLHLDTQVGCSGYRIDLAARDPEHPDRYVLGIECDGASYHSAKTARDRDRLRQSHLESLGWTIHRIWSADWFAHPEREIDKALEAFAAARHQEITDVSSERVS
ncbi:MAG TPA: DUF4011 domain-containing protein [Ktedonobacterales bacterium]|nr:DUF4011 domain-containing protein [Ktedonobacterales bacterium]